MKYILILLIVSTAIFSCSHPPAQGFYGDKFDTAKAISVSALQADDHENVVVKGKVSSSCQDDGCWLELQNENGTPVHVDWDEKFHLPIDIEGRTVFVSGHAFMDSTEKGKALAFKATGVHL